MRVRDRPLNVLPARDKSLGQTGAQRRSVHTERPEGAQVSEDPARTLGSFSIVSASFVGLALVGFTAGAGMGWISQDEAYAATTEAPVQPSVHQSGLAATPTVTPSSSRSEPAATPATSTARVTSESSPSSTSREPAPSRAQLPRRAANPPAVGAPVAPVQQPAPVPYRPAPAPRLAPPPAPAPPAPVAPPAFEFQFPDLTLTQAPVAPQPHIPIQEIRIG